MGTGREGEGPVSHVAGRTVKATARCNPETLRSAYSCVAILLVSFFFSFCNDRDRSSFAVAFSAWAAESFQSASPLCLLPCFFLFFFFAFRCYGFQHTPSRNVQTASCWGLLLKCATEALEIFWISILFLRWNACR
jgi:hypothetical protein